MALETITSIAMCKFIPCGGDATSSAKPSSWTRKNLSERTAMIEEAIDAGKETTASAQTTTDSRILTKSEVSVSVGPSTRNEKTADENREKRKGEKSQRKKKQGKEKSAGGHGKEGHGTRVRETTRASNVAEVLNEAPSDKQGTATFPEPEFVPEDWWIQMACDYWEMDEEEVLKIVSTLQKKNNLVATEDLEAADNAVGGMQKQLPPDVKEELSVGTELLNMKCTKNGELQPFQFQPGVRKAREYNPSPNWESSSSSKRGGFLRIPPLGATSGRLVQPACQPHPPSLPAPERRKNPRARRFVKPVGRDQRSLKELAHCVGGDDSCLPEVNCSGGRAASTTMTEQGNPGVYSGNATKGTQLDRLKRSPRSRQQTRDPKFLLPHSVGLAGFSGKKICCRLNAVPKAGKLNIVPIMSGHL